MRRTLFLLLGLVLFLASSVSNASAQSPVDRREIRRIGNGTARAVAWSPDGKLIAIGGSLGIWLYTFDLKPLKHFEGNDAEIELLAWSPSGHQIASISQINALQLWDAVDGKVIPLPSGASYNLSYSSDGSRLAVVNKDRQITIWNTKTLTLISTLHTEGDVFSLAWPSGDITQIAVGGTQKQKASDGTLTDGPYLQVFDTTSGKVLNTFTPPKDDTDPSMESPNETHINGLRWTDQKELTAKIFAFYNNGEFTTVTTWNTATNELIAIDTSMACGSHLTGISFSPDDQNYGLLIQNCGAYVDSRPSASLQVNCCRYLEAGSEPISDAVWSPDSQYILVVTGEGLVELVDLKQGDPSGGPISAAVVLKSFEKLPAFIYWSGNRILYRQYNYVPGVISVTSIDIKDLLTQATLQTIRSVNDQDFQYPTFSPDDSAIAVIGYNTGLEILDTKTGKSLAPLMKVTSEDGGQLYVNAFYWSPDSTRIATQFAQSLYIWDATSGKIVLKQKLGDSRYSFNWSPDNKSILVIPSYYEKEQSSFVIDANTGQTRFTLEEISNKANASYVWGPAGRSIAAVTKDQIVRIWNTSSGKLLQMLSGYSLQWSPDGAWLAVNNKTRQIQIYNTSNAKVSVTLNDETGSTIGIAYSPDSLRIATTDLSGVIHIWDAITGKLLFNLTGHKGAVTWVNWKPDGTQLLSAGSDGTLRLWDTHIP